MDCHDITCNYCLESRVFESEVRTFFREIGFITLLQDKRDNHAIIHRQIFKGNVVHYFNRQEKRFARELFVASDDA
jgi:hypothetical protein